MLFGVYLVTRISGRYRFLKVPDVLCVTTGTVWWEKLSVWWETQHRFRSKGSGYHLYEEVDVGHQRRQTKLNNDYHKKEGHWKAQYGPWTIGNPRTESCAKIWKTLYRIIINNFSCLVLFIGLPHWKISIK